MLSTTLSLLSKKLISIGNKMSAGEPQRELIRLEIERLHQIDSAALDRVQSLLGSLDNVCQLDLLNRFIYEIRFRFPELEDQKKKIDLILSNFRFVFDSGLLVDQSEQMFYRNRNFFSQEGEDLILARYFDRPGFYVDVGAHHPFRFSNTNHFYNKGWMGINIEPNPEGFALFQNYRTRDLNLNFAIGPKSADGSGSTLKFYQFDESALNTVDPVQAKRVISEGHTLVGETEVPVISLLEVVDKHLGSQAVDFLSVDCEGFDFEVLKTNDWSKFRPEMIVVEITRAKDDQYLTHPISEYLNLNGYRPYSRLVNSAIFRRE